MHRLDNRRSRLSNRRKPPGVRAGGPGATPARRRPIILVVVGSLVASLAVQSITADPAEAQSSELCDTLGAEQFSDVGAGDYGADYILCMKVLGLSVGKGDGRYGPDDSLTRGQMATFLVRLWQHVLGRECPEIDHPFRDVKPSSAHAAAVGCLYGLGITAGTGATTYEPSAYLKASQISLYLLRLWELLGNSCPLGESDLARAGACLTALHVTPDAQEATSENEVSRAQMAVYLIGLWHQAAGAGAPPEPPSRPSGAPPGKACGLTRVGDWYYGTWEDPGRGTAHSWELWSAGVSWERPDRGLDDDCWWDAKLSLVCWEEGDWYYSLSWDDVGQVAWDGENRASMAIDPGDPDLAWTGRFSIEAGTTEEADPFSYVYLVPDADVAYDWADYVDDAIGKGRLRVVFPDTGSRIVFEGTTAWKAVFEDCGDVLEGETGAYSSPDACRPDGINAGRFDETTAGFPLPSWAAGATGVFRVAVVFTDFPDARASPNDKADIERNLKETERYLETAGGGRLDVQLDRYPGWITARKDWREYAKEDVLGNPDAVSDSIVEETALSAERLSGFDGASYDSLMVVLPRSRFGGGQANTGHSIGMAAGVSRWALINNQQNNQPPSETRDRDWWFTASHELVHNLGLADLYPYDPGVRDTPEPPGNKHWVRFEVGLMGLEVSFPASRDAYPYVVDWPSGYLDQTEYDRRLQAREMLAWSRWQLGWLDEARVACLAGLADQTVELVPRAAPGSGIVMVAIPHHTDDRLVIVAESRRPLRFDQRETVSGLGIGDGDGDVPYTYTDHSLPGEGVVVYLVWADRRSGELPLLLGTDSGDGEMDGSPVMARGDRWWLGEPGTTDGQYLIEVVSSTYRADTIRVTFTP